MGGLCHEIWRKASLDGEKIRKADIQGRWMASAYAQKRAYGDSGKSLHQQDKAILYSLISL